MSSLIRTRQKVHVPSFSLDFQRRNDTHGSGFGFPCTKEGKLLLNEIKGPGLENLVSCLAVELDALVQTEEGKLLLDELKGLLGPDKFEQCLAEKYDVTLEGIVDYSYDFWEPAQVKCDCGALVDLTDSDYNTCDKCERLYGLYGTPYIPRHLWEEPYDPEDYY